ncbi:MAG: hypothetical protein HYU66_05610 [Armatimonadetes bacterium]|nr:hypothetical protein [Armatimonadota bacterium]
MQSDASGRFRCTGLLTDPVSYLSIGGFGIRHVNPPRVVDLLNQPQPVEFTVERVPVVSVTARVVNGWGRPLAGIPLRLKAAKADQGFTETREAVTGRDGGYLFESLAPDAELELRARPGGRRWLRGGTPLAGAGAPGLSDLVLVNDGAVVRGRVLDAAGRPAAGATVVCLQAGDRQAVCDAQGRYVLRDLPDTPLRLVALYGRRQIGRASAHPGAAVVLRVSEPRTDPVARRQLALGLLRRVWRAEASQKDTSSDVLGHIAALQAKLDARAACARVSALPGDLRFYVADRMLARLADDPQRLRYCLDAVYPAKQRWEVWQSRARCYALVAGGLPPSERAWATAMYEVAWRHLRDGQERTHDPDPWFGVALAAETLGKPDAEALLDRALKIASGSWDPAGLAIVAHAASFASHPALFRRLIEALKDDPYWSYAVAEGVRVLAVTDPARALALWSELPDPPRVPPDLTLPRLEEAWRDAGEDQERQRLVDPWGLLDRCVPISRSAALTAVLPALARQDLGLALDRCARAYPDLESLARLSSSRGFGSSDGRIGSLYERAGWIRQRLAPALLRGAAAGDRARLLRILTSGATYEDVASRRLGLITALKCVDPALAEQWYADLERRHPELLGQAAPAGRESSDSDDELTSPGTPGDLAWLDPNRARLLVERMAGAAVRQRGTPVYRASPSMHRLGFRAGQVIGSPLRWVPEGAPSDPSYWHALPTDPERAAELAEQQPHISPGERRRWSDDLRGICRAIVGPGDYETDLMRDSDAEPWRREVAFYSDW